MAKRFIETGMFEKPLISSLEGPYKLLFLYYITKCDHAGILDIHALKFASFVLGHDYNREEFEKQMNGALIVMGDKWFMPSFVEFQYGVLNESNRAHKSVMDLLSKNGIDHETLTPNKGLKSPLGGCKDKESVKVKVKVKAEAKIPTKEEVIKYLVDVLPKRNPDWTEDKVRSCADLAYDTALGDGWKDGHGKPIVVWKNKFQNIILSKKHWNFGSGSTSHSSPKPTADSQTGPDGWQDSFRKMFTNVEPPMLWIAVDPTWRQSIIEDLKGGANG